MSLPRIVVALGLVCLVFAATVGPSSAAADQPDDAPGISLVEQRVIEIPGSQLLSLSPEGGSIAVTRPRGPNPSQLCIHDVVTLTERVCADVSGLDAGLWPDSVVWSPDSEWLAFAELWPQYNVDGDLWLMDASTGALTNLLDDGYRGVVGSASEDELTWEDVITLPTYPTFTPDNAAVAFSRTVVQAGEFESADIATVPITGGDAVPLGDLERQALIGEYRRMQWTADGSRLYVSLVDQGASRLGPDSGIWVFEADGQRARQLLGVTGPDDWPPSPCLGRCPAYAALAVISAPPNRITAWMRSLGASSGSSSSGVTLTLKSPPDTSLSTRPPSPPGRGPPGRPSSC
jgi:hypothetical protein